MRLLPLLRLLACSLLVGGALAAPAFAQPGGFVPRPAAAWLASLDAAPVTEQTLSADRSLRSLKLDSGVVVTQAGFSLTLESGLLITTGDEPTALYGGPFGTGSDTALRVQTEGAGETLIESPVIGSGPFIKTGPGRLSFYGETANTLTGLTTVEGGILALGRSDGVASIAGDLVIGDGLGLDVVRLYTSEQIADTATVTLRGGDIANPADAAHLDLNGASPYNYESRIESVASLVVAGNAELDLSGGTAFSPNFLYLDSLSIPPGSRLTVKNWRAYTDFLLVGIGGVDPADVVRVVFEGTTLAASIVPYDSDYLQIAPLPVITFPAIPDPTDGDAPLTLRATSTNGQPVYFDVVSGHVTLRDDGRLQLDYPGEVTLRAWQENNDNHLTAEPVERTFTILRGPPPANDDFADATLLSGDFGTFAGNNRHATSEPDEPGHEDAYPPARSLWWRWTAPADGHASFDNRDSALFGYVEVYRGEDLASLELLSTGANHDEDTYAAVIEVAAGVTYHIRLTGFYNQAADFRLNWTFLTTPVLKPAARITSQGFTASWSGNARAYRLEIFDESDEYTPRLTIPVANVTTRLVRGLASDTAYTFRVVATDGHDLELPSETSPLYTLYSETSAPDNDFTYSATELEPSSGGTLSGDNRHATNETFETGAPLASVWYRWTPPSPGLWRVKIAAAFPASLALYPDADPSETAPLASAPPGAPLDWETPGDTPYLIRIAGEDAAQGAFTLTWELVRADTLPANDDFADAAPLPAFPESVTASNRFAGVEEEELDPGVGSLWWRWTAPLEGAALVSKTSDFSSRLGVFAANQSSPSGYEHAPSFGGEPTFEVQAGETYFLRIDGEEPAPRGTIRLSLRFVPRLVLAPATAIGETGFTVSWNDTGIPCLLRLYDSSELSGYSPEQTIFIPPGQTSHTFVSLRPGTAYRYVIRTTNTPEQISASKTTNTLPATGAVPVNDAFHEAITLTPNGGSLTASNLYASNQPGEANEGYQASANRASLWYVWTAPTSGEWRFSLAGSAVPAAIEIYINDDFPDIRPIAEASDSPTHGAAACTLVARAGETFHIALLGVSETRGDLALAWSLIQPLFPPANDDFDNAQLIEGSTGSTPVTLDLATEDDSGPYPYWTPTVWFRWQAPATEKIRFTLSSASYRTGLSLYTGAFLDNLSELYSVDGTGSDDFVSRDWQVQAGVVYRLRIEGEARLGPDATLTWSPALPLPAPTVVTRGARFVTLRLPPHLAGETLRRLIVSPHADLSDPLHRFFLFEEDGDYVVSGLLPSTRYYYQLSPDNYYLPPGEQPDTSVAAIGTVDTAPDKSPTPANDFDHPVKVAPSGGTVKGTTLNATARGVWYSFTPAIGGLWKVRVSSLRHDSYFTVYRAPTVTDPDLGFVVASAYDENTGQSFPRAETVERLAPLRAGVTYLVAVDGYAGDSGPFTLSLALDRPLPPPPNDDFAAATVITGNNGSITCDARLATNQPEELGTNFTSGNPQAYEHTIWWRWTAPSSGRMRFRLEGPHFYSELAIFTGESLSTLYGLARGYSPYRSDEASAFLEVEEGRTYHVRAVFAYPPSSHTTLNWSPAPGTREQIIDFPELATPLPGQTSLTLIATASSGLPIIYRLSRGTDDTATLEGNVLSFTGPGWVAVIASQPGDDFYAPAHPVTNYVNSPLPATSQSISFPWPGDRYLDSVPGHLLASASSGLPVQFEIVSGPATVTDNVLTVTGLGKVVVRATQPGDATTPAATPVEQTFHVLKAPVIPPVSLARTSRVYNGRPHPLTATTLTPDAQVTYTYKPARGPATSTPPTDAGTYTVTATLDDPARSKSTATLVIAKAPLTVTGPALTRLVGEANPAPIALAYSGFVNGENASVLDRPPVAIAKASTKSPAGVYPITVSGGTDNNYAFDPVPGRLTVLGFGGAYEALLFDSRSVALGKLEITVPAHALAFTGVLTLVAEPDPIAIRGSLAGSETPLSATGAWARTTDATIPLTLSFRLEGDTVSGSLRRDDEDFLSIPARSGARLYFPATKTVPPWAGAHTFLLSDSLPLDENDYRPLPRDGGHATAAIASSGGLTLKGRLSDGTPLTASARLDVTHRYRLLVKPYAKRPDSFLSGPLALVPHPDQIRFPGRLHAAEGVNLLAWAKLPLPDTTQPSALDPTFREGFEVDALVHLDPWLPPVAAKKATKTTPAVTLADRLGLPPDETGAAPFLVAYDTEVYLGESEYDLPATLAFTPAGKPVIPRPNPTKFALTVNPATGAFSGSFVLTDTVPGPTKSDPDATKLHPRKVAFSGVLRQPPSGETDAPLGQGVFLLPALPDAESTEQAPGEIRLLAPFLTQ